MSKLFLINSIKLYTHIRGNASLEPQGTRNRVVYFQFYNWTVLEILEQANTPLRGTYINQHIYIRYECMEPSP